MAKVSTNYSNFEKYNAEIGLIQQEKDLSKEAAEKLHKLCAARDLEKTAYRIKSLASLLTNYLVIHFFLKKGKEGVFFGRSRISTVVSTGLTITLSVFVINGAYQVFLYVKRIIEEYPFVEGVKQFVSDISSQVAFIALGVFQFEMIIRRVLFQGRVHPVVSEFSFKRPISSIKNIVFVVFGHMRKNGYFYFVHILMNKAVFPSQIIVDKRAKQSIFGIAARVYNVSLQCLRFIRDKTGIEINLERVCIEYDDQRPEEVSCSQWVSFFAQLFIPLLSVKILSYHTEKITRYFPL